MAFFVWAAATVWVEGDRNHGVAKRRARVEELEPRVLLSGDLAGVLALPAVYDAYDEPAEIFEFVVATEQHQTRRELVLVDAGIEDWETLKARRSLRSWQA